MEQREAGCEHIWSRGRLDESTYGAEGGWMRAHMEQREAG